jgi:hypothetical protein
MKIQNNFVKGKHHQELKRCKRILCKIIDFADALLHLADLTNLIN